MWKMYLQKIEKNRVADSKAIVKIDKVRFTVLTSRIIRMEYSEPNKFEDRASQVFWYRKQPIPNFEVITLDNFLEVITDHLHLRYRKETDGFTGWNLSIELRETEAIWHYGDVDDQNLKGTTRTLDASEGIVPLENGLMSRSGWSVIDDSKSLVFNDKGWLEERKENGKNAADFYFFGYGSDYEECLKDYCKIAGSIPLIPRWALGNWWSRYWEYSQEELSSLMNEFGEREIPLSVCIIDMDWHIVKIKEYLEKHSDEDWSDLKFHSGWTGFTWNEDLFPDHVGFLKFLHQKGLKSALNIHPAEGVHAHEQQYEKIAEFLGTDSKTRKPIKFDITDPKFTKAYFKFIYHPYEEDGVDFWWMDYQQEPTTKLKGLDPLWWLNHLAFYDLGREGKKRPFTFSRWGNLGNHRYQIGFSGDTFATWKSLSFLPYFTSTASNVGYTWWSHDLGGHMGGFGLNPELYIRWIQFGLFSPIFRLHSTKNSYNERLPWGFNVEVMSIAQDMMRLRHAFIPYIYSMAWKTFKESVPLIRPMYYLHPNDEQAYECPNQYYFGTELICSPFISEIIDDVGQSRQELWIPPGMWFNFFTGEYIEGGHMRAIYGKLEDIPVFARAGAIIPLARGRGTKSTINNTSNPSCLDVVIFPGKDNSFKIYEDDGETQDYLKGKHAITEISLISDNKRLQVKINTLINDNRSDFIPEVRTYNFLFKSIRKPDEIEIKVDNKVINDAKIEFEENDEFLNIKSVKIKPSEELEIIISKKKSKLISKRDRTIENCTELLRYMKVDTRLKEFLESRLSSNVKDIKLFNNIFNSIIRGITINSNISPTEAEFLKNYIPIIKKGNFLEKLLPENNWTIKDKLFEITTQDNDEQRKTFMDIMGRSDILNVLFSMKKSQLRALIEVCGAPIIV